MKFGSEETVTKGPGDKCRWPKRMDPRTGTCRVFLGEQSGPNGDDDNGVPTTEVGEAVMGRYGAALEPGIMNIERAVCLAGMQLGKDGLCYNKGAITNSQRLWPRGRRPLLTGGDMRAIGQAARAANKLTRTTKRLESMGMIKKRGTTRRALPRAHVHALPKGV